MAETFWDEIGTAERYPPLKDELRTKGSEVDVVFKDDGRRVSAEVLAGVYKQKGLRIKAKDAFVFAVNAGGTMKSFWLNSTNYSVLQKLKKLRDANSGTLIGKRITIKRVSTAMDESNYDFS